jgi:hypothetical protein
LSTRQGRSFEGETGMNTYILDDQNNPVEVEGDIAWVWGEEHPQRKIVGLTRFPNGTRVSTVFLSLDHGWNGGPPVLWETMIFENEKYDGWQDRYITYKDAVDGHLYVVKTLLAGEGLE